MNYGINILRKYVKQHCPILVVIKRRVCSFLGVNFAASFLFYFFYPIYFIFAYSLKCLNVSILWNVEDGVGHIFPELDNFFRKIELSEIDQHKRYWLIRSGTLLGRSAVSLYAHKFAFAYASTWLFTLLLPLGMSRIFSTWVILDSGLSRTKPKKIIPKSQGVLQWARYYQRCLKNPKFYPLLEYRLNEPSFLSEVDLSKAVLVYVRTNVVNSAAEPTNSSTLIPALKWLQAQGYFFISVGRGPVPVALKKWISVPYSEMKEASLENDVYLFSHSAFAIINASGLASLAGCLSCPVLYLNSWHLFLMPFNQYILSVPCLIKTRNHDFVSFEEQGNVYFGNQEEIAELFPKERFIPQSASAEDILAGAKELITFINENPDHTQLQKRFFDKKQHPMYGYLSQARISQAFVEKYKHLLPSYDEKANMDKYS